MFQAFLKFLGGEPGEEKQMWLLLGKGFFMGIFLANYQIGSETLFLKVLGKDYLDVAFFTAGFLGIVTTSLFVTLQKRINYSSLVVSNAFIVFVFIAVIRYLFEFIEYENEGGGFSILPFVLFVMIGPITAITILGFWGVFGRMFDARQSKRIIGGIDTGQLTATIIAFFSIPLIIRLPFVNDTYDLLFVSAIAAFGILVFTIWIIREYNLDKVTKVESGEKVQKVKFFDLLKDKYLLLLSLFLVFSMGASVFVDYTFYTATETMFPEEQKLSDFLSFFSGTVMIMSFLIQSFVNDVIIGRFGLRVALMTMPAILVLFTIGAIISGHIYGYEIKTEEFLLFFMFTVSAKAFTASLKDALESPAFKLFFLPIDVKVRFDIQTRIEGVINQFATLAAGAAQIGLGLLVFFKLIHFSYFIIGLAVIVAWLASKLFAEYKVTLRKTLEKQKEELSKLKARNEHSSLHALKSELKMKSESKVRNALRILEKLDPIEFEFALLDQLDSRHVNIRKTAYLKLEKFLSYGALGIIKSEAKTEGDTEATEIAHQTVQELEKAADFELTDVSIRKLVRSTNFESRMKGARLLSKLNDDKHIVYVLELLRDINPEVRSAAMATAGKIKRQEVWPVLIENLHLATYGNASTAALAHAGEVAFHNIDTSFYKTGQYKSTMFRIIQILGKVGGRQATELLWKKIDFPDKKIVSEILRSLSYIGFEARDFQAARIKIILESIIGDVAWNIKTLQDIPQETPLDASIRQSFYEENKINSDNIFMLLSMIYDPHNVSLIKENIEAGTTDSVTFGMEMLDLFCEEELKPKLFPIMDNLKDDEKLAKLQNHYPPEHFQSYQDLLLQIINRDYNRVTRYTKALAMLRVSRLKNAEISYDLVANLFNSDKLLLQTAAYAIYLIDKEAYHLNTKRLRPSIKKELDRAILPPVYLDDEEFQQDLLLIEKVILLKSLPQFSEIHGEVITYMAEALDEIKVKSSTKIIELGDKGSNTPLYIIRNGEVSISTPGEEDKLLVKDQLFGEKLLLATEESGFEALTVTDCSLLVLRKEELFDLMAKHVDLVEVYLRVLNGEFDEDQVIEEEEELAMDIL